MTSSTCSGDCVYFIDQKSFLGKVKSSSCWHHQQSWFVKRYRLALLSFIPYQTAVKMKRTDFFHVEYPTNRGWLWKTGNRHMRRCVRLQVCFYDQNYIKQLYAALAYLKFSFRQYILPLSQRWLNLKELYCQEIHLARNWKNFYAYSTQFSLLFTEIIYCLV